MRRCSESSSGPGVPMMVTLDYCHHVCQYTRVTPTAPAPTAPAPTAPAGPAPTRQVDGRHRRRATNRDAAADALLGLYDSGSLGPSIAEGAEAAGLSPRSVFRYFDDAEDLVRAAIGHQQRRLAPLFSFDVAAGTPLPERIDRFV